MMVVALQLLLVVMMVVLGRLDTSRYRCLVHRNNDRRCRLWRDDMVVVGVANRECRHSVRAGLVPGCFRSRNIFLLFTQSCWIHLGPVP